MYVGKEPLKPDWSIRPLCMNAPKAMNSKYPLKVVPIDQLNTCVRFWADGWNMHNFAKRTPNY
jgi:hypothetical protein